MKERMERKGGSGSGLFLMEMIVVVFFFVICASQCILAFATSERMSRQGRDLNRAVTMAETIVEVWKAEGTEGLMDRLGFWEEEAPEQDGRASYIIRLDEQWEPMEGEDMVSFSEAEDISTRMARIEIFQEEGGLSTAVVTMNGDASSPGISYRGEAAQLLPDSGDRVVFVLKAKKYEKPQN